MRLLCLALHKNVFTLSSIFVQLMVSITMVSINGFDGCGWVELYSNKNSTDLTCYNFLTSFFLKYSSILNLHSDYSSICFFIDL